jgi:amino-acid N-acetyltransferase
MNKHSYVEFFRQTSPYIHAHRGKTFVIALEGDAVLQGNFHSTIHDIALLQSLGIRVVLVHGARPQIDKRLDLSGLTSEFHDGRRITSAESMLCVKEAVGSTRLQIESELSMGLPNSPMHGAKIRVLGGNFITAKPVGIRDGVDFQRTGEIRRIDASALEHQLIDGAMILLSPLGFSPTGETFNLSYQEVAAQTAIALNAEKLIFVSRAEGIFDDADLLRNLSLAELEKLVPTSPLPQQQLLNMAAQACRHGVDRVHVVGCEVDGGLLTELFTRDGSGTLLMKNHSEVIRPATIDDVGGILDLIGPLEQQAVLVKRSRELLETEISRFMLVVHPEGLLLGCAALYPTSEQGVGELACVATHAEFHGQGIASRLFDAIVADAQQQGLNKLFVLTTQTAHWFVEKGFTEAGLDDLPSQKQSLYNYQRNSRIFSRAI